MQSESSQESLLTGLDHGLRRGHLRGDGDLGRRAVGPVPGDGRHVDVVRGERGEVLDGVLLGLGAHQDGDGGHLRGLGHPLGVDELLEGVVADLVVDGHEADGRAPAEAHGVGGDGLRPQVEHHVLRADLLVDALREATEAVVSPGQKKNK